MNNIDMIKIIMAYYLDNLREIDLIAREIEIHQKALEYTTICVQPQSSNRVLSKPYLFNS